LRVWCIFSIDVPHAARLARSKGYDNPLGTINGGESTYPCEIEEFLYTHPKIEEVEIIGVPDSKYGEEVCAWIKLHEGKQATAEGMRDFSLP